MRSTETEESLFTSFLLPQFFSFRPGHCRLYIFFSHSLQLSASMPGVGGTPIHHSGHFCTYHPYQSILHLPPVSAPMVYPWSIDNSM